MGCWHSREINRQSSHIEDEQKASQQETTNDEWQQPTQQQRQRQQQIEIEIEIKQTESLLNEFSTKITTDELFGVNGRYEAIREIGMFSIFDFFFFFFGFFFVSLVQKTHEHTLT